MGETNGVATPEEAAQIRKLDASIDLDNSAIEDLLNVARLMIDPMYNYERALAILHRILQRQPESPWAIYWYSYCVVHYLMDDKSVSRAKRMIESWLAVHDDEPDSTEASGALLQMLMEVRSESGWKICSCAERIMLLEESIRRAPSWTFNRWLLAGVFHSCGRDEDAVEQLSLARQNMVQADPAWSALTEQFESVVTGRADGYIAKQFTAVSPDSSSREILALFFPRW